MCYTIKGSSKFFQKKLLYECFSNFWGGRFMNSNFYRKNIGLEILEDIIGQASCC